LSFEVNLNAEYASEISKKNIVTSFFNFCLFNVSWLNCITVLNAKQFQATWKVLVLVKAHD